MDHATWTLLVLLIAVALFAWNRLSVGVVAVLVALSLLALGIVDVPTALGGFGDPVVVFIATLFVVAEGLDASGVTARIGRLITRRAGGSRVVLVAVLMVTTAVLSAVITPNGAAAAMIPVVLTAARGAGLRPSSLLMPVAFAASAGALLTLSGSVVNVMASQASLELTGRGFGFFEFALAGVPLVAGTIVVAALTPGLVPQRHSASIARDFGGHLDTLLDHYEVEKGFSRLRVAEGELCGRSARSLAEEGIDVYAVQTPQGGVRGLDDQLSAGDTLLVTGPAPRVKALGGVPLSIEQEPLTRGTPTRLLDEERGLAEVIVPPRSMMVGQVFFTGMRRGSVTVLGLRRAGRDVGTRHIRLDEGDALLLHGTWDAIHQLEDDDDILMVDSPSAVRRQAAPIGPSAWLAGGITLAMVAALATGVLEPAIAGLVAACAMVATRVVTVPQAYRAVSWQTVVLIAGMIPMSVAIRTSGAGDLVADAVMRVVGQGHTVVVLAAVFLVTAVLGQAVSNTATALIMIPIATAIAQAAGMDPRMVLMSVALAAGASLLTPIATPANMMVGAAGGYSFGDYWRLGAVTMVVWFAVAVLLVPVVWS